MSKKTLFRWAAFGLLFAAGTAGVFAQVTVSGGFALSSLDESEGEESKVGVGGNIYADYLLPVSVPVSLGVEIGIDVAKWAYSNDWGGSYEGDVMMIPLLARVAYHFDLLPRLDLYVVGKLGYALPFWEDDIGDEGYVSFGFDVGAAYYLSPTFGLFAEAGYDRYGDWFTRFLTVGISIKFNTTTRE